MLSKISGILMLLILPLTMEAQNFNYINNKAPLHENPFIPLPITSVKADGWLLTQLNLQKDGLTGNAEMLYKEDANLGAGSDWLGGKGDSWERVPYYVKGLIALAYVLDDGDLIKKARKWVDWSIDNQSADGYFGPANNADWWCRMPMLYAIKEFYEATGDARVIPFLTKYFQYENSKLDANPLSSWGRSRAGDNIDIVFWLYNRTGDAFLLDLADKLKSQAYNWTDIFTNNKFMYLGADFQPKHNVNVPQALKMPAIYYQKSNDAADRDAFKHGRECLMRDHGQPCGMESGNEMINGKSSVTGLETCSTVEQMQSCEEVQMILGDPSIGDILEKVAFNALPAAFRKDFKGHAYYTQTNQVKCQFGNVHFGQEYDNGFLQGPYSGYPCCRFNMHMGWPYYVKNMWAATHDGGLAAMAYGPCHVTAKVSNGSSVSIVEKTNYPFEEQISFVVSAGQQTSFPLKFRIPAWSAAPVVKVNGIVQKKVIPGTFYTINRIWNNNDVVVLELPMKLKVNDEVNNSVSIERGPLVYSLKIGENWITRTDYGNGFVENEILPTTKWNYALVLNKNNPDKNITVNKSDMPANPFVQAVTPVTLTAHAKLLPDWKLSLNGLMANDPPYGPVVSKSKIEKVTLIPFGAQTLRVTCLPYIGKPSLISTSFNDDFSDGNQVGWVNYNGSFMVENGEYVSTNIEGAPGGKSIQTATSFSDFSYEAKIQVGSDGDAGLLFRVNSPTTGPDAYNGYYVGFSASGNVVVGKANGSWTPIKTAHASFRANTWFHVKIVAMGASIKVFIDETPVPVIEITDTSFSKGAIGVRTYGAVAKYDDISVKGIKPGSMLK
ncbi:MAG: glycoside hydrolase family 127 protein [Bacteroidota bacterium]|nr:glycoside hydrolase family 127 protein [Bacteroidota bacterium]